jgi:hypothetical protein
MKFVLYRTSDLPNIHVHLTGKYVDVQYSGGKDAVRCVQHSTAHARALAEKISFWSGVNPAWEIPHLLQHCAWELEAAIYAARRRSRRSAFST